jgi:hypothetical protein
VVALGVGLAGARLGWFRSGRVGPDPQPVPSGDCEIAWLNNPTSFETWENFVWGVKRAEMAGHNGPTGLQVDDSGAFPVHTTAVPEIVVRRNGYAGSLRIRWYKVTDDATQEDWVKALAARDPAPLAVVGGWSSYRAKELAEAMRTANWGDTRPLLFLTQATADTVLDPDHNNPGQWSSRVLISVYDRSFRFCFTNRQMAEAVTDFVLFDPGLRPGPAAWPGLHAVPAAAAGPWAALASLAAQTLADVSPVPGFAIEWEDDPYSRDLNAEFRKALCQQATRPPVRVSVYSVPFSTGRLNRPNRAEAEVAEHILANLPPPGTRSVLVLPTVSAPARRTLRALVQGDPEVGRQLVAVNGDGLGMNTFFRDREFAWPVRSLPIPFVLFTHADPFGWDRPGDGPPPPPGYELAAPPPGEVRTSTEDIRLFTRMAGIVAAGVFPDGSAEIARSPKEVADRLHSLSTPFFDAAGDRLSDTGEYVVALRPVFPGDIPPRPNTDATLEVYTRQPIHPGWTRVHAIPLGHTHGGHAE